MSTATTTTTTALTTRALVDSDTGEHLRAATAEQVAASDATTEGHILVDGRRCYVEH